MKLEAATEARDPLLHADQAEAAHLVFSRGGAIVEPATVIGDRQTQSAICRQGDVDLRGVPMAGGVADRLANYQEQLLARLPSGFGLVVELELELGSGAIGKPAGDSGHCGGERFVYRLGQRVDRLTRVG